MNNSKPHCFSRRDNMFVFRLFFTAAIAVSTLVASQPSITPTFEDEIIDISSEFVGAPDETVADGEAVPTLYTLNLVAEEPVPVLYTQCPLTLGCCEEDCCGEGTSWQSGFCVDNPSSSGFDGTYSREWIEGCVERVCCESSCCGPETEYDDSNAVCVPKGNGKRSPIEVGEPCTADGQCVTEFCFRTRGAQFCSCNPETAAGCSGDEVCASSEDLIFAQGVADVPPSCFLPLGAKCDPTERTCLSTNCDKTTLKCACSTFSNWPCDTESGEVCVLDESKGYVCQLGDPEIPCPKPTGICTEEYAPVVCGDCEYSNQCQANSAGFTSDTCEPKIGCKDNQECESGYCYLGLGSPGTCSCNPETNVGCPQDYKCAGSEELAEAQGLQFFAEPTPECLLPFGAACSPDDPGICLTGVCDYETKSCTCNSMTNYPCDTKGGETCVFFNASYVCSDDPLRGDGPFEINEPCIVNDDCVTGYCFYGFQIPGSPGTCTCNPDTNVGCSGEEKCASSEDLMEAQFLADASAGCYLPDGATCDPTSLTGGTCLSGSCDETTLKCACSTFSNYPCDIEGGEVCVLDESNRYVCQ